jgi:predicted SAM-dependent methyltransferase
MGQMEQVIDKLRLGERGKGTKGWVNLDSHPSADIVAQLPELPLSVIERQWSRIEGIHVWEHLYKWDAEELAAILKKILRPGGELVLECPNLEVACRAMLGFGPVSNRYRMHVFYGDPRRKDPSYGHRWGYTPATLVAQLIEHGGFGKRDVRIERARHHVPDRDFRVVARKR